MRTRIGRLNAALALGAGLLACMTLPSWAAGHDRDDREPAVKVIASGLLSPRGLDFAPNGQLYVTESGAISSAQPCTTVGRPKCYTETGAITLIDPYGIHPAKQIIRNLPTLDDVGPGDISFLGMKGYVVLGLGTTPEFRSTHLASGAKANQLGTVISFIPNWWGKYDVVADIAALETSNPDGYTRLGDPTIADAGDIDSNPFGILALPGRTIVADAGGNDLFEVKANGSTRLLAVFPAEPDPALGPRQRVPSRVTLGPDGYLYVADEAFSSPLATTDGARIYRVPPNGCQPVDECEIYVSGLQTVMDLEFDRAGNLYFLEYLPGILWKIDTDGVKTAVHTGLRQPGGLALSHDAAYVSNKGVCFGKDFSPGIDTRFGCANNEYGEVLRIPLTKDRRHGHGWN